MDKLATRYNKEVYIQCHRSKNKHKKNCTCTACTDSSHSQRRYIQKGKQENNSLFDIGIDIDTLEGDVKEFYKDQKAGVGHSWELSNEVDEEYEEQRADI